MQHPHEGVVVRKSLVDVHVGPWGVGRFDVVKVSPFENMHVHNLIN